MTPQTVTTAQTTMRTRATTRTRPAEPDTAKGDLSSKERDALPGSSFAYIDSQGERHLPIHDEGHVKAALGRFNQTAFEGGKAKKKAARKILARASSMGIDVSDDSAVAQAAKKTAKVVKGEAGDCSTCHGTGKIMEGNRDCPDCGPGDTGKTEKAAPYKKEPGETVECPECHKYNSPDAKFCDQCGAKLPAAKVACCRGQGRLEGLPLREELPLRLPGEVLRGLRQEAPRRGEVRRAGPCPSR